MYAAHDYMTGWTSPAYDTMASARGAARRHNKGGDAQVGGVSLCRAQVYEVDDEGYLLDARGRGFCENGSPVRAREVL